MSRRTCRVRLHAPEQLTKAEFLATLAAGPIGLFVIDEARCISNGGTTFGRCIAYSALRFAPSAAEGPRVHGQRAATAKNWRSDNGKGLTGFRGFGAGVEAGIEVKNVRRYLLEQDDEWAVAERRYFSAESMKQLTTPALPATAQDILAAIA
jgi:hypothetical protein